LYFHKGSLWKLTDFGISGQAKTSGATTVFSRGTPCYRPPELYLDLARFTETADIWALGCILYECLTGSKAFLGDYAVIQYSENERPTISVQWPSKLWRNLVISTVYHLLRKDPSQRPTATSVLDILTSYRKLLVRPLAEPIFEMAFVSFPEWIALRARCSTEMEWLYELQDDLRMRGEEFKVAAKILREEAVHQYFETIERLHEFNLRNLEQDSQFAEDPNLENTKALFTKLLPHLPEWLVPWVCYEIAVPVISIQIDHRNDAISICKAGMGNYPQNVALPMLLSQLYAEEGRYDDAVETEREFFAKHVELDLFALEVALCAFHRRIFGDTNEISTLMSEYMTTSVFFLTV